MSSDPKNREGEFVEFQKSLTSANIQGSLSGKEPALPANPPQGAATESATPTPQSTNDSTKPAKE